MKLNFLFSKIDLRTVVYASLLTSTFCHAEQVSLGANEPVLRGHTIVDGLGSLVLPQGEWQNETSKIDYSITSGRRCFVFKKLGAKLERITFIRYLEAATPRKASHVLDSLSESLWQGIPQEYKTANQPDITSTNLRTHPTDDSARRYESSIIIEDNKTKEVWLQHSVVYMTEGTIIAIIHMSEHAISPQIVQDLCDDTKWQLK